MIARVQGRVAVPTAAWIVGVVVLWPVLFYLCGILSGLLVFSLLPVFSTIFEAVGLPLGTSGLLSGLEFTTQAALGFVMAFGLVRIAVRAGAPCVVWRAAAAMSALGFLSVALFLTLFDGGIETGLLGVLTVMSLSLALAGFMALGACKGARVP